MRFLRFSALSLALVAVLGACSKSAPGSTASPAFSVTPTAFPRGSITPSPLTNLPKCAKEKRLSMPTWVPKDLPLPPGTFFTKPIAGQGGYNEGLFVIPLSTSDIAKFVLSKWQKAGYQWGRGDAEPGEVEDQFAKYPGIGAFKAQDAYCRDPYSITLLIWAPDRSKIGMPTTGGGSPLPGASSSPTPSQSPSPSK